MPCWPNTTSPLCAVALLLTGCHLVYPFDLVRRDAGAEIDGPGDASPGDASPGDASPGDASPDTDAAPLLSFGSVTPIVELITTSYEDDPTLTGDMLEIYFESNADIWRATRASLSDSWSSAVQVAELNSSTEDGTPDITTDGLTIFIGSRRSMPASKGGMEVFRATRLSRSSPWSSPELVEELNSSGEDICAAPTADLLTVVFDSDRSGGMGGRDLYISVRTATSLPWGPPSPLSVLNSSGSEQCAWIDAQGTLVLFASNRPGAPTPLSIWFSVRTGPQAAFSAPALVGGLNSAATDDSDPWLSPDGQTLYFVRNTHLFVATRSP